MPKSDCHGVHDVVCCRKNRSGRMANRCSTCATSYSGGVLSVLSRRNCTSNSLVNMILQHGLDLLVQSAQIWIITRTGMPLSAHYAPMPDRYRMCIPFMTISIEITKCCIHSALLQCTRSSNDFVETSDASGMAGMAGVEASRRPWLFEECALHYGESVHCILRIG